MEIIVLEEFKIEYFISILKSVLFPDKEIKRINKELYFPLYLHIFYIFSYIFIFFFRIFRNDLESRLSSNCNFFFFYPEASRNRTTIVKSSKVRRTYISRSV